LEADPMKRTSWQLALGTWVLVAWVVMASVASGQPVSPLAKDPAPPAKENPEPPAPKVEVTPAAEDEDIGGRLTRILKATGWYENPEVRVEEGVVFLRGRAATESQKKWAGDLARNTQDVVAVVNRIEVAELSVWDFSPALVGLNSLGKDLVRGLPWVMFTLLVLVIAWLAGRLTRRGVGWALRSRMRNALLRRVVAWTAGLLVFLIGLYVVLQVAGLTRLAVTVLGGTGVLGLILGIAFRDISENFLASLFLSIQHPFRTGDLVEVSGVLGYVQRTTVRSTVLMTLDGNHVQVPNATVYKSVIRNYTSNPARREEFEVGIGYEVPIPHAQEVAQRVLAEHPAVLKDPEPWVLAHALGKATVTLKVYFWLDGAAHSWLKVKSSVIRLVKRAFQEAGISMPDEAREVLFPQGLTVRLTREAVADGDGRADRPPAMETVAAATSAEGGLTSEAGQIRDLARQARAPEEGENLLKTTAPDGGA
jgi:small-conductance mechanosensitive channel